MFHPYPPPRIRNPFQLIPPVASGTGDDGTDDAARRHGEGRDTQQRVLVVEDDFLIATVLTADLQAAGYEVIGPCMTVAAAMESLQSQSFDTAILDINLKGELVYPVAEELARRHIPFLFLSGYALVNMPERFRAYPRLAKPADWTTLLRELQSILRPKS